MDTEDGQIFVKNLAYFVKTHEKALANALYQQQRRNSLSGSDDASKQSQKLPPSSITPYSSVPTSYSFLGLASRHVKTAKLTLTPHHLFYLITRFQELSRLQDIGIEVGPTDIRLESLHSDASHAYVSFLSQAQRQKTRNEDRDSLHSMTSIRSVMSSMSSLWARLGLTSRSTGKNERQKLQAQEDLKYLYSAFTKVPCLRLSPDYKAPLIAGYEEFPFDTAVPLIAFKNLTTLEICDVDFRQLYGWNRMAEQLRSLTIKRGRLDDPADLLVNIVLDDMDKRRRRSAQVPQSPSQACLAPSPVLRQVALARTPSAEHSLARPVSLGSCSALVTYKSPLSQRSPSPSRPSSSQNEPWFPRSGTSNYRRSSASSGSQDWIGTQRGSTPNLVSLNLLPVAKWRFLRYLNLSDNNLASISCLSLVPVANTLQILDLSYNPFRELPDSLASLVSLKALNVSHCLIRSIESLGKCSLQTVSTLNLRGNKLASLAGLETVLSLERVDLRENRLTDPAELACLARLPNITDIYVNRNPFTKTHADYRITIFNLFRQTPGHVEDVLIDAQQVTHAERRRLIDRPVASLSHASMHHVVEPETREMLQPVSFVSEPVFVRESLSGHKPQSLPHRRKSQRGSPRTKKFAKRRVMDPAQEDDPASSLPIMSSVSSCQLELPTDAGTFEASLVAASTTPLADDEAGVNDASMDSNANSEQPVTPVDSNTKSEQATGSWQSHSLPELSKSPAKPANNTEFYKRKIESLRTDFGSSWLSALSDERWDQGQQSTLYDASCAPIGPSPVISTMSQSLVSTGGTLG